MLGMNHALRSATAARTAEACYGLHSCDVHCASADEPSGMAQAAQRLRAALARSTRLMQDGVAVGRLSAGQQMHASESVRGHERADIIVAHVSDNARVQSAVAVVGKPVVRSNLCNHHNDAGQQMCS